MTKKNVLIGIGKFLLIIGMIAFTVVLLHRCSSYLADMLVYGKLQ